MKSDLKLEFYCDASLLEGPCWDSTDNSLYVVSIRANTVFRIDTDTGRISSYETDGPVGCAVVKNGQLITAEKSGIYTRSIKGGPKKFICQAIDTPAKRYNDGKLDPKGRFYIGTIGDSERLAGKCELFRINDDNTFTKAVTGTTVSNGLGWSGDGKKMYFIDTPTHRVMQYDYDLRSGEMSNGRVRAEINDGSPDGMCVDPVDDTCFVAHWGGGKISHWDMKTGKRLEEIALPVTNVSSCTVGGKDLDMLYITTAKCQDKDELLAGGLFSIKIR